ncbi:hypothetical protein IDH44_03975 [Paenibacillus sp. IB182496]|uniref:Uncharacterized protein n=1 Tax=Paenibacillus sabuli TaxID=2772509 RepID=A0A927GR17_9BACL|nr:hypothetical protein [Paenibacillus sabuli]MBD2844337.1 hypothetical protein [Paenibacillus sabuli]
MIPLENCLPYDKLMNDIYVNECPFCGADNVLLPLLPQELALIRDGKKKLLVFPCCHSRVTIVDTDSDYLLTTQQVRSL